MKDGNAEDTRNLLPVDDAANECVPQEWNGRTMQFSNFHPATLAALRIAPSLRSSPLWSTYHLRSLSLYHPQTRTIIKHVDSRPQS